ncbi:MAG: hypothetical protein K0R14_1680 [Burkholderiales bacterium]|jgi:hypothetical protein|nr:hypothetical protein [Burkholderiales bacterium]
MTTLATRVDTELGLEFGLLAKMQHKTKSQLLKELILTYLHKKNIDTYVKAVENIANHEKSHANEYADLYDLAIDWE